MGIETIDLEFVVSSHEAAETLTDQLSMTYDCSLGFQHSEWRVFVNGVSAKELVEISAIIA